MTFAMLLALATGVPTDPPAAGSLPTVIKAEPAADLDKLFRRTEGWIGARRRVLGSAFRQAHAVALQRYLGRPHPRRQAQERRDREQHDRRSGRQRRRREDHLRDPGGRRGATATHSFAPPDGKGWFWLFAGYSRGWQAARLPPANSRRQPAPARSAFSGVDVWLGTVSNPLDEPTKWKIDYTKVPFAEFEQGRAKRSFGSAVLRVEDHVYIYGYEEKPGKPFPSRKLHRRPRAGRQARGLRLVAVLRERRVEGRREGRDRADRQARHRVSR